MATLDSQQTWEPVPYETTKDCSQGFCTIDCPQWCYIIFPPPPPLGLYDSGTSGTAFSPLVIAIIGILASAFLLLTYYTVISKYCGTFDALRRRLHHHRPAGPDAQPDEGDPGSQSRRHEAVWHIAPSNGLEEALVNKITVYRYRRGEGLVDGTDCSVCLSEFREDDSLRLLPKCSHAFHLQCIDTWLRSHSNCPLCRANIVSTASPSPPQLPAPPPPELATDASIGEGGERDDELVVIIEDIDRGGNEGSHLENECDASKYPSHALCDPGAPEEGYAIIEIGDDDGVHPISRSFSMGSSRHGRVSIADVLRMSMEDEFLAAKDGGLFAGAGSSRRCGGEHSKGSSRRRGLHCVMSPVPMKRSFSSGRFCFTRQGRGRNAVLPM